MSSQASDVAIPKTNDRSAAATTQTTPSGADTRLVPMPMRLPLSLRQQLQAAAVRQGTSASGLARRLIESTLRDAPEGSRGAIEASKRPALRSCRLEVRLALDDARRTDLYASRAGIKRATALAEIIHLGLEAIDEKEGIPGSRADVLFGVLSSVETLLSQVGSTVLGTLVLNAYSVALSAQGKVSEDELLAQARRVGDDEWQRVLDELRHEAGK